MLTNFEYLIIYDTTVLPREDDHVVVAKHKLYYYKEYAKCFDEIYRLLSQKSVYFGLFDEFFNEHFPNGKNEIQQMDAFFLSQIIDVRH